MNLVSSKNKLEKKKNRDYERKKRFDQWRKQTENNSGCYNCFWIVKPWGQTPCKSCSRFDQKQPADKFKRVE